MSENTHGNRTQLATTRLRQMIVAGELAPGQRISEREIGEQLDGISRTPLREAFKVLAAEGLVTISPNRGASVTALSMAEVDETIELLVGLEGLAAETACSRISEQDIAAIDELHQHMAAAYRAGQLMAYFELNQAIHQRLVDAAGNRRHERWERALAEHQQILDALKARNGALLRELLGAHHHNGWRVSRALVEREFSADAAR